MFESSVQVTASIYGGLSKAFYDFSTCLPAWRIVRWRYLYDRDANRGLYSVMLARFKKIPFVLITVQFTSESHLLYMSANCVGLPEAGGEGDYGDCPVADSVLSVL